MANMSHSSTPMPMAPASTSLVTIPNSSKLDEMLWQRSLEIIETQKKHNKRKNIPEPYKQRNHQKIWQKIQHKRSSRLLLQQTITTNNYDKNKKVYCSVRYLTPTTVVSHTVISPCKSIHNGVNITNVYKNVPDLLNTDAKS